MGSDSHGPAAKRVYRAVDVALHRAGTKEGCQQLYSLLSDDHALVYLVSISHHALKAMATRMELGKECAPVGLWFVREKLCQKDARLGATPQPRIRDSTCIEYLPQEAKAPWRCEEWVTVCWLQRALAGAMCGAPLSKGTGKEESTPGTWIAETLMALSRDMLDLIFTWWSKELQTQGNQEFPTHLVESVDVSMVYIRTSFPYAAPLLQEPDMTVLPLAVAAVMQHIPAILKEQQKATKLWLSQEEHHAVRPPDASMPQKEGASEGSASQESSISLQTHQQLPQSAHLVGQLPQKQEGEHRQRQRQHSKKGKKGKAKASSNAGTAQQQEQSLGPHELKVYGASLVRAGKLSFVRANNLQMALLSSFASLQRIWTACNELVAPFGDDNVRVLVNCASDLLAAGLSCNLIPFPEPPGKQALQQGSTNMVISETLGAQKSGAQSKRQAPSNTKESPSSCAAASTFPKGCTNSASSSSSSGRSAQSASNPTKPVVSEDVAEFTHRIQERAHLVLSAVEGIRCCLWVNNGGPLAMTWSPGHVLACINCIYVLTYVAQEMSQEAASPEFLRLMSTRKSQQGIVRSWCSTCSGLCEGATIPLQRIETFLEQASGSTDVEAYLQQREELLRIFGGYQKPRRHPGSYAGDQPQSTASAAAERQPNALHSDTVALLPVLIAAALQLSHAALAVVRITSVVVVPQLPPVPILAESADAISVAKAGQAALTLYHEVLSSAVLMDKDLKDIALASADDPPPKIHQSAQAPAPEDTTAAGVSTGVGVTVNSGVHMGTASAGSSNASSGSTGGQTEATTEISCSPARSPDSVDLMGFTTEFRGNHSGATSAAKAQQGGPASYGGNVLQREHTAAATREQMGPIPHAASGTAAAPQPSLPPAPSEQVSVQVSDACAAVPAQAPSLPPAAAAVTVAAIGVAVAAARAQRRGLRVALRRTASPAQQKVKSLIGPSPRPLSSISRSEMLPPDVCRHALAIASWSCNLPCIIQWLHPALSLYSMYADMGCKAMTSWESISCSQMCTALIRNLSMLAATASALMAITNGDLPGWLGSLAPSGTLTSTQLFYRIAGVYTSVLSLQVPSSLKSYLEDVIGVHTELMPLLSLAWQLPRQKQQGVVPLSPASDAPLEGLQPGASLTLESLAAAFCGSDATLKSVRTAGDADLFTRTALRRTEHALEGAGIPAVYATFADTEYLYACLDSSGRVYAEGHQALMQKLKPKEPLFKLMLKERKIWSSVWKVQAEEEGEAEHRQLLEAYVVAAAEKAAAQLPPELAQELKQIFT